MGFRKVQHIYLLIRLILIGFESGPGDVGRWKLDASRACVNEPILYVMDLSVRYQPKDLSFTHPDRKSYNFRGNQVCDLAALWAKFGDELPALY